MKKILLLLLLFGSSAYADVQTDKFLIEKPDGSVVILYYVPGSFDTLSEVVKSMGLDGLPIQRVSESDIPKDRSDRDYWRKGIFGKIEIDSIKKQADIDSKSAKESESDAVFEKLKITKDEFKKAQEAVR